MLSKRPDRGAALWGEHLGLGTCQEPLLFRHDPLEDKSSATWDSRETAGKGHVEGREASGLT